MTSLSAQTDRHATPPPLATSPTQRSVAALAACFVILLGSCDAKIERFDPNLLYAVSLEKTRDVSAELAAQHASDVVNRLFGTPNQPRWPVDLIGADAGSILQDTANLDLAVGKVSSDETDRHKGLYREHCVICHGVAGSGNGPASLFQNPYPRDFRHGVFKWKSTERNAKPTRNDWLRMLRRGIPGSSMPSFALLSKDDLNVLIDYTIYLSVRGQVERELMAVAVDELDYEDEVAEADLSLAEAFSDEGIVDTSAGDAIRGVVAGVAQQWADAPSREVDVPKIPTGRIEIKAGESKRMTIDAAAIARGRELFEGQIANCVGCHGKGGNADVATLDYDDWTKEYTTRIGITPTDREALRPLRDLGALPPRQIQPRKLSDGVFHGAGTPEAIYRQITQGIAGSPMPAVLMTDSPSPTGLTSDQVWDLVAYVLSLSQPAVETAFTPATLRGLTLPRTSSVEGEGSRPNRRGGGEQFSDSASIVQNTRIIAEPAS